MKAFIIILLLFFFTNPIKAQNSENAEQIIQNLYRLQDDTNYEEFYETLMQYLNDPLDLNKVTKEDLENLYILSPVQIKNLIDYREQTGSFLSLYELQAVPGFDETTIKNLLPFIIINNYQSNKSLWQRIKKNSNNYLITRIGISSNDTVPENSNYRGDANKMLIRFRHYQNGDYSFGFAMKKDAGENITLSSSRKYYLFDYTSFHFNLYNKKFIKALSIGDYRLQFGQALVLGGGFNLGKGAETILTAKRNNSGIRPHTSASEYGYFRGGAITIKIKNIESTLFVSHKNIDGNIDTTNNSFTMVTTGYHRSSAEMNKRKNVSENIIGGNISLNTRKGFHWGITGVETMYDKTLTHPDLPYNLYNFRGKNNYTVGSNFNYLWKNFNFFGEAAISQSKGKGLVTGFLASLTPTIEASMVIRNYEKNFHSFYANAFKEGTSNINEKGIYWGLKIKPSHNILLTCYYDRFKFPWLKYQINAPSQGYEYLFRLSYTPSKKSLVYFQYRVEDKDENYDSTTSKIIGVYPRRKSNYLLNIEAVSLNLKYRTRIQYSSIQQNTISSSGFAIIQDIEYSLPKFLIAARIAMFDTDDFDNRQYVYERNLLYTFSIPFYYGQGIRSYIMIRYKVIKNADLWIRFAKTKYTGLTSQTKKDLSEIYAMMVVKI